MGMKPVCTVTLGGLRHLLVAPNGPTVTVCRPWARVYSHDGRRAGLGAPLTCVWCCAGKPSE